MQRKGLSDVVTTVLLIAVALVAVMIIWNFISPTLQNANINTAAYTSQFSVSPNSVTLDPNSDMVNLNVERKAGDGNVVGFLVGLQDPAGNIKTFRQNLTINELESKNVGVNYTDFPMDDIVSITVTPIFKNNQTMQEQVGQTITTPVPAANKKFKMPSGLVAQWKFNGDVSESINGLTLTKYGNANIVSSLSKFGSGSASFDGSSSSYYSVTDGGLLDGSAFSVVAWVNLPSIPTQTFSQIVYRATQGGYYLQYNKNTGNWEFYSYCSGRSYNLASISRTDADNWEFVAGTFNSGQISVYDNENTYSSTPTCTHVVSTQPFWIGQFFGGNIDEVMFFNRALSAQEISDIRTKYKG